MHKEGSPQGDGPCLGHILVTNDDGIFSGGLWKAVEALKDLGEVTVVAPDREQSGVGTAVTLHHPLRISPFPSPVEGVRAYSVEGTPSDCVILALEHLLPGKVGLIVSGINQGANLGEDVLVSGTVGATFQGYFRKIPAIAISVTALKDVQLEPAARALRFVAAQIGRDRLPRPLLLNINLPNLPGDQIEGLMITRLDGRAYMETIQEGDDGRRKYYWISRSKPVETVEEGTDTWAVRHSRVSVTPLLLELTALSQMKELEALGRALWQHLKTPPG